MVPSGNSIVDTEVPIKFEVIETTVTNAKFTKFANLTVNSTSQKFTIDTKAQSEVGSHFLAVKLTDRLGASCSYNVFNVIITNTAPYFLTPPALKDIKVQFNHAFT